jgi:hypothetical protein
LRLPGSCPSTRTPASRPLPGRAAGAVIAMLALAAAPRAAAPAAPVLPPPLTIRHTTGPIVIDGDLSDAGWKGADSITTWYETRVGDNVEPQVGNIAWLAYDDDYLYAGFEFEDPAPASIRSPLGDHDAMPSSTDYAGIIVDSHNDGKTATMFLANSRGVQYDAVSSDATGEDNSPDFYWDAAGKITPHGWNLEIRVPFSSLRYGGESDPTWRILLYRNYPRDRRYQFFSARLPRDVNCFICNSAPLVGLSHLPHGSHLVVAPYATTQQTTTPRAGLGTPLESGNLKPDGGADLKWSPAASLAVDAAINPDFSQVESDVTQIAANERFAIFYPEKRPFFLEGVDLLSSPMTAVYTRTVTDPKAGLRATGKIGNTAYTALVTQDRGGGLTIIPGPQGSRYARQDFVSEVGVARLRHDFGRSFVSFLTTGRILDEGGHNVVAGPDFQWRPRAADSFTGQALWSQSDTPNRPTLAREWDGRELGDHALQLSWSHGTPVMDWYLQGQDLGPEFRADDGFITQVGYREAFLDAGLTTRPQHAFLSRVRFFTTNYYDALPSGQSLNQHLAVGTGMDGRWNSFVRVELNHDNTLVGTTWLERFRPRVLLQLSPSRLLSDVSIDSYFGQEIDFDNARRGTGATFITGASLRPGNHLELRADVNLRWLDVDAGAGGAGRLFTAQVERLRGTWSFSARSFLRLIGQFQQTTSDPALYTFPVDAKDADFTSSALFAYKINWQTVLYAGYGDQREFALVSNQLENKSRQAFAKISYAWQR